MKTYCRAYIYFLGHNLFIISTYFFNFFLIWFYKKMSNNNLSISFNNEQEIFSPLSIILAREIMELEVVGKI